MPEPRKLSVFLCHASQDKPIVRELYQRLIATDWIDPWLDEEKLSLGQHWTSTIEEAIDSADSVIIFLSQNSVQKEGFVQRELNRAWNRSLEKPQNVIFLIPFRLDDCEVPYNLRERHWGDYFGLKKEKTYESLLHSLKQRHEQKLLLERKEQARAEELTRIHKEEEDRIRRTREEEERARVQAQEARIRKVAEAKENSVVEDQQARKKQDKEELAPQRIAHSAFSRGGGGSGILLDGAVVHYETLGRGRPVIFLHSWIGSWRYWYSSMQVAARAFRSYGLDLWGFGDTAHSVSNYSLEQQATLLDRFLTEMAIGKIALIGHGLGALVGMTFATRFPQSVDRLMAVSCPLDYRAVNARLRTASLAELAKWLSSHTPEATTALLDTAKADVQAIAASLVGLQANNIFSNFRALSIPCLLVYGDKDPAIISPDWEFSHSAMTQQVQLEGSGHFPMLDEPALFERLMMNFLWLKSGMSPMDIQIK